MKLVLPGIAVAFLACPVFSAEPALQVEVDAREFPRRMLHADLKIPVPGGPVTLVYPKWIPGEHGPNGPIGNVVDLRFESLGKPLKWQRDPLDMFSFHVDAPSETKVVEAHLDFLLLPEGAVFSSGASSTGRLGVVSWNQLLLYPQGARPATLRCAPRLRLPRGWNYSTALMPSDASEGAIGFRDVSLSTLVDSPVLAGLYMKTFELGGKPGVFLHVASDHAAALEARPETIAGLRRLVGEANVLFGAHHYAAYHFLFSLSNRIAHFGLEHHESSDDRDAEQTLLNPLLFQAEAALLPHEYVHSWNGKYRRPAGLATQDFQEPMRGDLLWIYEGLTEYLGDVLAARAGLWGEDAFRENLARDVAELGHRPGRLWRPLLDTAVEAQVLFRSGPEWGSVRRDADFYDEGELIWLETDVLLRQSTHGASTLDDFCREFFGGASGSAVVNPYTLNDVVAVLNRLAPRDWAGFFASRVDAVEPQPPTAGIEEAGWRVAYAESEPEFMKAKDLSSGTFDLLSSIGGVVRGDGVVVDVVPGMALDKAGFTPGERIVEIGGQHFSQASLRSALKAGRDGEKPIAVTVDRGDDVVSVSLDYREGEKYPRLERDPSRPDLLKDILAPRQKP
jgi:predicted metalloprotease with PDZ domain